MKLWQACQHHLEQSTAAERKRMDYAYWTARLLARFPLDADLAALDTPAIMALIEDERAKGNSPATIYAKVSLINCVFDTARRNGWQGVKPAIPWPRVPTKLKWWLDPATHERARQWCLEKSELDLLDFLDWTVLTGLRVEESLRVTTADFEDLWTPHKCALLVPGTKNDTSHAWLAISEPARCLAVRVLTSYRPTGFETPTQNNIRLFPCGYRMLARAWRRCRRALGIRNPTATLKACRRTFARNVSATTPLPVLQGMMRHATPSTTLGYLKLVGGGYTLEEQRKYL